VGVEPVGGLGLGADVRLVDEDDVDAEYSYGAADGPSQRTEPPELADHHAAVPDLGELAESLGVAQRGHAGPLATLAAEAGQHPQRFWPAHAVATHAASVLELRQGRGRLDAEDAVHSTGVETEPGEFSLQGRHVVAAHVRRGEAQETVPKVPTSLHQSRPGRLVADAGRPKAPRMLELGDRLTRGGAVHPDVGPDGGVTGEAQATLQVTHGVAALTRFQQDG
jgi:hypothetical protein